MSVIIPVYNVEPYMERCFQTVLSCDLRGCEIILSCGRSADRSDQLCEAYARRYPEIRVLRQDGAGLSNARNCALDAARGEYVLFLDSDDFVDSGRLDTLIAELRAGRIAADLIAADFRRLECPSNRMVDVFQIGRDTPVQREISFLPRMLRRRQCFWNVWRYVFRLDFLKRHDIRFWENRVSEDVDFITSVFLAEPETVFYHCPYYVYVVGRGGSLMDSLTLERLQDTVFILSHSVSRLRDSGFAYAPQMMAQFQFEYLLNLALAVEIEPAYRAAALALYQDWENVLAGSRDWLVRLSSGMLRILGARGMGEMLHIIKMLRRRWRRGLRTRGIKG